MKDLAVIFSPGASGSSAMAAAVAEGAGSQADLLPIRDISAEEAARYDRLAIGCSSLEGDFQSFFAALAPKLAGKKVVLFGASAGEEGSWTARAKAMGANLCARPLILDRAETFSGLSRCRALGAAIAHA